MSTVGANITQTYDSTTILTSGEGFSVGDRWTAGNGKVYKFVLFDNGTDNVAAVAGNVAYYMADTGYNTHTVTMDLSSSSSVGAGVFQSVPADGEYCWIQIRGPATVTTALTAGSDGNALTATGATDGTLDVSAAVTDSIVAFAVDASAKFIACMFPE